MLLKSPYPCGAAVAHMNELEPCLALQDPINCTTATATMKQEISDVLAFKEMLSAVQRLPVPKTTGPGTKHPAVAFTVLVTLHNMVTETIAPKFMEDSRRKYVCATDALREVSKQLAWGSETKLFIPDLGVDGLPGLSASHRLVSCSV
eukprot:s549_g17.t1